MEWTWKDIGQLTAFVGATASLAWLLQGTPIFKNWMTDEFMARYRRTPHAVMRNTIPLEDYGRFITAASASTGVSKDSLAWAIIDYNKLAVTQLDDKTTSLTAQRDSIKVPDIKYEH